MTALFRDDVRTRRPGAALVARSALLGWAAGARASLGLAGPTIAGAHRPVVRAVAALGVVGELIGDKLPTAPSRLDHGGGLVRATSGAIGASMLATRGGEHPVIPAFAGAIGGLAGAYGGAAWRAWAVGRLPAWQAAVAEDLVALTAATIACGARFGAPGVGQVQ
ncbi:hypothetical protein [Cellulomonas sp. Leaf334]|uniref:hypothetical protein n=1 Tax=Cellulomonas sp. Leaf334 TaxID=1736339 RepID=UPI0006FC5C32|nr:hypothetical protein [Cellulomonas sp. Leaf334]KQR11908.1 hypothetical protein ASF78_11950 [Cellulomonas sp. Leaf334]